MVAQVSLWGAMVKFSMFFNPYFRFGLEKVFFSLKFYVRKPLFLSILEGACWLHLHMRIIGCWQLSLNDQVLHQIDHCSPPFTPFLTQSICPLSLVLPLTMCSSPRHLPRFHCTWLPLMKFYVCTCIVSFEATSFEPSSFNMQKYTCCNLHNAICCDFVFKSFKLWRLCEIHI